MLENLGMRDLGNTVTVMADLDIYYSAAFRKICLSAPVR